MNDLVALQFEKTNHLLLVQQKETLDFMIKSKLNRPQLFMQV